MRKTNIYFTKVACEFEVGEVREPLEKSMEAMMCWVIDSDWESKMIGDGEELFGDEGEGLQVAVASIVIVVDEESEDTIPTLISYGSRT